MSSDEDNTVMTITPLGGGQEVGRSCILVQYRGRTLMLDCGTHPGREGNDSLPFFDAIDDISKIDLILITHFHIDHCAGLPYFTEKANFKGKILMTHATKAVMKLLLSDNIRLQSKTRFLYDEQDLQSCIDKIDVMDFHQTINYKGIKVTASAAGHVLGAAMFHVEIDGVRVLYTGDYSMEEDRHLIPADATTTAGRQQHNDTPPDVLIVESTFGVTTLPPRVDREFKFTSVIHNVAANGGCVLIPVFALGRAQELLLILDEYWQQHSELAHVPVYYASRLANKAMRVYQTFVNTMSEHIRESMDFTNPFKLQCIQSMPTTDFNATGPCVVMAAPGFLQTGVSRELFEQWCEDEKNACIIAGYTVEGTLAHDLLLMPREITCLDGRRKQRRCLIEHISFAAHVDYTQNSSFIRSVAPDNIILVHGEKTGMKRLKDELDRDIRKSSWPSVHKPSVAIPENGVKVKLQFHKPIQAEIVGAAATDLLATLDAIKTNNSGGSGSTEVRLPSSALLVTEEFSSRVLLPGDLPYFTPCKIGCVENRVVIPLPLGFAIYGLSLMQLKSYLEEVFDEVEVVIMSSMDESSNSSDSRANNTQHSSSTSSSSSSTTNEYLLVQQIVAVHPSTCPPADMLLQSMSGTGSVVVQWQSGPNADMIADASVGIISQALSVPSLLRRSLAATSSSSGSSSHMSASSKKSTLLGSRHGNSSNKKAKLVPQVAQPAVSSGTPLVTTGISS